MLVVSDMTKQISQQLRSVSVLEKTLFLKKKTTKFCFNFNQEHFDILLIVTATAI